jgi:ribosomal protein S18 acetylase RimI-like enzyme
MLLHSHEHSAFEAIFLEKEYRGRGIGEQIVRSLESTLKEQGLQSIKLYVFAHNKPAHGLYKKLGYEISNSYANDDQMIGFLMKKELNQN